MVLKFGIDISEWQSGVDYARAVNEGGVEFAILRAGYSTSRDDMFETHYNGFSPRVPVGAYLYSYAKTAEDAEAEAAAMIEFCNGKAFGLPLFIDMEESSVARLGRPRCTQIALAFCDKLAEAGYRAGVYANANWFRNYLDAAVIGKKYAIWCAAWSDTRPSEERTDIWQYGGEINYIRSNAVPGVGQPVDQNYILNEEVLSGFTPAPPAEEIETEEDLVELTMLQKGMEGESVKALQILLNGYGFDTGYSGADGIFGTYTDAAVRRFQKARGLDVDGIVGNDTWSALLGVTR
jgi:GH25 family lysozyme M1 (1,4-beta-N-acetylmuramidase)